MNVTTRLPLAVFYCCLVANLATAQDDPGLKVYQRVNPSVVSLKSIEGSGTGFVLEEEGLILTNAHVVTSPLPYQMRVDVIKDGKTVPMIFKKVKIEGVHPKLDLALVRVDAKAAGVKLIPVTLSKTPVLPGQGVYAIGNPGAGDGTTLDKTITRGIVSQTGRIIEGVPYIQHDAAINPGNSGGPLCNAAGEIVGVNTLKAKIDGVGYALPVDKFRKDIFVPLEKREKDDKKTAEILREADRVAEEVKKMRQVYPPDHPQLAQARGYVAYLYSMALAHDPGNKQLYIKIGSLMYEIDRHVVATAYLARGIELDPWFSHTAYVYLGQALGKLGKPDMATLAYTEAIAKFPKDSDQVAIDLAKYSEKEKQFANAAFYSKLAIVIGVIPRQEDELNKIYDNSIKQVPAGDADKVRARCEAAGDELKTMKSAASAAKTANQKFLNKQFEQFVLNYDAMTDKSSEMAKGLWGEDDKTETAPDKPVVGNPVPPATPTTPPVSTADAAKDIAESIDAAKTMVRNKEKEKAVEALKALVTKYPDHAKIKEAKDLLAVWDKGSSTGTTPVKPPVSDATSKAIQRKLELAQIFKKSKQDDKAIAALQEIIDEYPSHPDADKARDLLKQWKR